MKLFNRKPKNTQIPTELEPYYSQQSGWRVWVRRIIAALVVIAIVFAIGWAAYAVYRQITDNDTGTSNETSQTENGNSTDEAAESGEAEDNVSQEDENTQNTDTDESAADGASTDTTDNGQDETPNTMPRTGDDPTDEPTPQQVLPATGG